MEDQLVSITQKAIRTFVFLLIFIVPLLVTFNTNELFEFPKMTFVYTSTFTILTLFLVKSYLVGRISIPQTRLDKPILAFLLVYTLSTILSIHLYTSIFGYYTRFNGGFLSIASYVTIFLIFTGEIRNKKDKEFVIDIIFASSALVSIYAILQNFGIDRNFWIQDSQARVFSTLGQPNWLAAYLVMVFPLGLIKLMDSSGIKKVFFFLGLLTCFSALWFTYSLSGLLGFLAALTVFFLTSSKKNLYTNRKILTLLGFMFIIIAILKPGIFADRVSDVKKTLGFVALAQSENIKISDTTGIRLDVWKGALKIPASSLKNLVIGSGPETFAYSFLPFRPRELNSTSEWDFLFNKAHNDFLDKLSNLGISGLALYLYLLYTFTKSALEKNKGYLLAGVAGLLTTDFFGWQTVTTGLLFWIFLAITDVNEKRETGSYRKINKIFIFPVILIAIYLLLITFKSYKADIFYASGRLEEAVNLNPMEATYQRRLTRFYSKNPDEKFETQAKKSFDINPKNMLTIKSLIGSYANAARSDPKYLADAISLAEYGSDLSPTDAKLKYILANLYYIVDDTDKAKEHAQQALTLKPNYQEVNELLLRLK